MTPKALTSTLCRVGALAMAAGATAVVLSVPASAADCSVRWGSQPKAAQSLQHGTLLRLRAGRHECFDRLVIDLDRDRLGWTVRYVAAVRDQGRGEPIALRGGAFLELVTQSMATQRVALPATTDFRTLRQVGWGGSFEGYSTVGLGVRARLPFRAFTVPGRLVVDVAHHW